MMCFLDQQEVFSGDMDGYCQAVRTQAHIDPEKTSLDAPDFSIKIRASKNSLAFIEYIT